VAAHVTDIANESEYRSFRVSAQPRTAAGASGGPRGTWAGGHDAAPSPPLLSVKWQRISTIATATVYRRRVLFDVRLVASVASGVMLAAGVALTAGLPSCTTVDPGPNFVVPDEQFDADFFFCRIEPELLAAKKCGPGDPASGDPGNGCHFNSSAVSGMALAPHPPVDCADGHPTNRAQVGAGSGAQGNLQAVSLEMSRDYLTAPLYLRPTGQNHPRTIFPKDDAVVDVIRQWAMK
jgi:hypothetical protein